MWVDDVRVAGSRAVIAIDGPAGSGKSTTAREVAQRLGLPYVESGALYRALTLAALDAGTTFEGQRLVALALSLPIRLALTEHGVLPVIAGAAVTNAVRAPHVTSRVSDVSAIPEVRAWANQEVRSAVARMAHGAVLDGRDIGTVVFPDAAVKVFLHARSEVRARRRLRQDDHEVTEAALAQAAASLARRDEADSTRSVAPLKPASDAVLLDTSDLTFEEQVRHIVTLARNALPSLDMR